LAEQEQVLAVLKDHLAERREEREREFDEIVARAINNQHAQSLQQAQLKVEEIKRHETHLRDVLGRQEGSSRHAGRAAMHLEDMKQRMEVDRESHAQILRRRKQLELEFDTSPSRICVYQAELIDTIDKRWTLTAVAAIAGLVVGLLLAIIRGPRPGVRATKS
jgi:hypothetical protein